MPNSKTMPARRASWKSLDDLPLPILHEDEDTDEMGEADLHTRTTITLFVGVECHLNEKLPELGLRVFCDLNTYYEAKPKSGKGGKTGRKPCFASDIMVVSGGSIVKHPKSYTIGNDGPAPLSVTEVLSEKTAKANDLNVKLILYAKLGIKEYILVDPTGELLPQCLLLKELIGDKWHDHQDADGGVTSRLGFRIILDADGNVRVVDGGSGEKYPRPHEGAEQVKERKQAEQRIRELEAELKALRKHKPNHKAD